MILRWMVRILVKVVDVNKELMIKLSGDKMNTKISYMSFPVDYYTTCTIKMSDGSFEFKNSEYFNDLFEDNDV